MITVTESIVNTAIKAPFVSFNQTTGLVAFADMHILKDGILAVITPTYAEIGNGLYVATFTPVATGLYTFFIEKQVQGIIKVVSKSIYTYLQNIEDVEMGSWIWDKNANTLVLKRQDGTDLAGFDVVDDLTTASRARTLP